MPWAAVKHERQKIGEVSPRRDGEARYERYRRLCDYRSRKGKPTTGYNIGLCHLMAGLRPAVLGIQSVLVAQARPAASRYLRLRLRENGAFSGTVQGAVATWRLR